MDDRWRTSQLLYAARDMLATAVKVRMPLALCLVGLTLLAACESRPQAPLLRDSPVYQNDREGFRFLVPEGWTQTANAMLPPGDFEDEVFLVRYRLATPTGGAMMQVLVLQEKAPLNLGDHHAGPSFGVEKWTLLEPVEKLIIGGKTAEHYRYSGKLQDSQMSKDVYGFRNSGRVYSFVGLFWSEDEFARQQIERAVKSTVWSE